MRLAQSQRGQLLVAGVVLIVVVALMVVALGFLYVSSERSSSLHNQSAAAYAAAYSGIEVAKHQFSTGTACNLLTNAQPVGSGQFSTTGAPYPTAFAATLASGIPAGSVSSVPLTFTSGSLSNLAPHGEITIGTESIDYGSTSATGSACSPAPCLGGIVRGANGTTAAAHTAGDAVTQANQCVIGSTGILGSATRILESTVQASSIGASGFNFASRNPLPAGGGTIASVTSSLPTGDNYIIAVVTFGNATANITTIPTGNLKLTATTAPAGTLAQTTAAIWVGGSPASGNKFPQEAQVLIGKHSSTSGTPTYSVTLDTTGAVNVTSTSATAQILVINGIASANASLVPAVPGAPAILTPIATGTTTLVTSGPVTAGNNIIIAQVQLDNTATTSSGGRRNINPGNLKISRGATVLMSNQFAITLDKAAFANEGSGYLLMTVDNGAAAGTTYTVTAVADDTGINGSASILVFNGFAAAVTPAAPPPGSVSFGTVGVALGSVPTTFPAGENVVLAAIQYENTSGGSRNIAAGAAGNETIILNGARVTSPTTSANAYNWNLCSGSVECDDYFTGLLWRQTAATATANPTFGVQSQADVTPNMTGAANVLAISLSGGVRRINTIEVYP